MIPLVQTLRPDTVVMVPVRDAFDYIQAGTIGLVVVILVVLLMILIRVLQTVEGLTQSIDPLVDRAAEGLDPVLERARSVSENVDYVSQAIRRDVEGLTEALDRIRGRLDQASDRMEERIEEFNALMELVQSEAEEIFLDTASAVRGVRAGSRSLARSDDASASPDSAGEPGKDGSTDAGDGGDGRDPAGFRPEAAAPKPGGPPATERPPSAPEDRGEETPEV